MPISLKNSTSVLPWARYSPQANLLTVAGETAPREMAFVGKSFAIDIENGLRGWLFITEGMRDLEAFPLDEAPPPLSGSWLQAWASQFCFMRRSNSRSPEAHEMCSNTGAHLSFRERLFNECEPKFGKGEVPIVKITEAEPIKIGKGKSRELQFEIVKMVPRPQAIIDALAKLKAAGATTKKDTPHGGGGAANDDVDDFGDGVTSPKDKPKAGGGGAANDADDFDTEGENSPQDKPKADEGEKGRGKKAAPEPEHSSDILDDPIPFG